MKKKIQLLIALVMLLTFALPWNQEAKAATSFKDVPTSFWAKDEIHFLVDLGIIKGYQNGNYGVNDKVQRKHAAIMLARAFELDTENPKNPGFKDVPTNHSAYKEIAAVVEAGIFQKAEKFNPDGYLTRAQMAKILTYSFDLRYTYSTYFKDVDRDDWFYHDVQALASNSITTGRNGNFEPNAHTTRTEFAVFMARIYDVAFRPGVQVKPLDIEYTSDGRIKVDLQMYNNTENTVFNIKGKYTLYVDNELVAQSDSSTASHPIVYDQTVKLSPNTEKSVSFYFKSNEIKKKVDFSQAEAFFLGYEHTWNYNIK